LFAPFSAFAQVSGHLAMPQYANSDEAARAFRDNVAQDSDMMSPGVWRLAGE